MKRGIGQPFPPVIRITLNATATAIAGASANITDSQSEAFAAPSTPPGTAIPAKLATIPAHAVPKAMAKSCTVVIPPAARSCSVRGAL